MNAAEFLYEGLIMKVVSYLSSALKGEQREIGQ